MNRLNPLYMDVDVEMGEWEKASGEVLLGTDGLGPCIGAALYDPTTRTGYVAHTFGAETVAVQDMLSYVATTKPNVSVLRGWLAGGQITEDEVTGEKFHEHIRDDAIALFIKLGVAERMVDVCWSDDPGETVTMVLDCDTGDCEITTTNIFEENAETGDLEEDDWGL